MPSPHSAHTMRSPLYPGSSSGGTATFTHCTVNKSVVRYFAVGEHLLLVLVLDLGMHLARQRLRAFSGGDANRSSGAKIDERRRDLAPVAELQRALAQAASGDNADGVSRAAVDLDEGDEPLAIFAVGSSMPSSSRPSIARRTPRTCPAQRWPWAISASRTIFIQTLHERTL